MSSFLRYNWLSILWALAILILCLIPGRDIPSLAIFEFDKLVHFLIYTVLALLMYYGWMKQNTYPGLHIFTILKILILTATYGFAVEIIQEACTTDRHFDIYDAVANASGAVVGSWLCRFILGKFTS